ncbi:dihydrolipoyl dehydrogenase family protein [Altibacter sp. HG106]|uniref:dihydrolipoyl dehydrogenase family protein n=1 Tax=Altibacter sp. HG106 TaxID=3023937 RepID=UPI002350ECB9|nr:NAD(P)/FAD-dependent oxidoreductase [Altibacter sp. HG106]MDC7994815.1 NAD(P)/FAD-dependent oxidoreductase [Altibacter sp. HG106]
MKGKEFDVFVIGTGTAGKNVAYAAAEKGQKVAIADDREYGGTCANRGCDPKKVLYGFTEVMQHAKNLEGKGIRELPTIDWKAVQEFKKTFTGAIPAATEKSLRKAGIEMYHQSPKFLDENTLSVEGKTIRAKNIVIATGLRPRELNIPGSEHFSLSEDFMELTELPEAMVFVGGGYVGMEQAHMAARMGVDVTVIERESRPLAPFDEDMASLLVKASEAIGINFVFDGEVTALEMLRKHIRVTYQRGGKTSSVKAPMVFNTSGRVPAIEKLNLEKGNVAFEANGITVNEYLQSTTNPSVYACGDVSASGAPPLTPLSSQEARVVVQNLIENKKVKTSFPPIPSVVFTIPQLASIGLTEKEAKKQGFSIRVEYKEVPNWFNAKRMNQSFYAYKTIVDTDTSQILGAHILAEQAGEMINLFAMAMSADFTCEQFKGQLLAYPTWGNDVRGMV